MSAITDIRPNRLRQCPLTRAISKYARPQRRTSKRAPRLAVFDEKRRGRIAAVSEGSQTMGAESHPSKNEGWGTRHSVSRGRFIFPIRCRRNSSVPRPAWRAFAPACDLNPPNTIDIQPDRLRQCPLTRAISKCARPQRRTSKRVPHVSRFSMKNVEVGLRRSAKGHRRWARNPTLQKTKGGAPGIQSTEAGLLFDSLQAEQQRAPSQLGAHLHRRVAWILRIPDPHFALGLQRARVASAVTSTAGNVPAGTLICSRLSTLAWTIVVFPSLIGNS